MVEPRSRRELRRAMHNRAPRRPGPPPAPTPPAGHGFPVFFVAVLLLVLAAAVALIGGVVAIRRSSGVAAGLLAFAVVAVATTWLFVRRTESGYRLAVIVLAVAGGVPAGLLAATGAVVAAVFVCPPLVVAIAMLRPATHETILSRTDVPGR